VHELLNGLGLFHHGHRSPASCVDPAWPFRLSRPVRLALRSTNIKGLHANEDGDRRSY